ncbi:hypothetical protein CLMAG_13340 [Clostridium magnum DSM 2767]|uniref:Uncharacterized protein n=1 Tax=Clostridium magnum DSM 2767 TaxID=1121326 RepID=A0A162UU09_9CLOT|nr:hypothetical protein CLMAG_13340 [Clostridium magnum DSM 2767]
MDNRAEKKSENNNELRRSLTARHLNMIAMGGPLEQVYS